MGVKFGSNYIKHYFIKSYLRADDDVDVEYLFQLLIIFIIFVFNFVAIRGQQEFFNFYCTVRL